MNTKLLPALLLLAACADPAAPPVLDLPAIVDPARPSERIPVVRDDHGDFATVHYLDSDSISFPEVVRPADPRDLALVRSRD